MNQFVQNTDMEDNWYVKQWAKVDARLYVKQFVLVLLFID